MLFYMTPIALHKATNQASVGADDYENEDSILDDGAVSGAVNPKKRTRRVPSNFNDTSKFNFSNFVIYW